MRFSLNLSLDYPDMSYPVEQLFADQFEQAIFCDENGFDGLTTAEHHFINTNMSPNPILFAQKAADITKNVTIMTAVVVLPFWDVRRLAGEIALASQLSQGRIRYGMGRGAYGYEFRRFNSDPARSREKFDDSFECLNRLLTEENVSWSSEFYEFDELTIMPRPYKNQCPEFWIAALSPIALYHCAKRGINVQSVALSDEDSEFRAQCEGFRKGLAEWDGSGRKPQFMQQKTVLIVRNDTEKRAMIDSYYKYTERFNNLFRSQSELVKGGCVAPVPYELDYEEYAANTFIGTASEITERLLAYKDLGIDEINLDMNTVTQDHSAVMYSLEQFSSKVIPQFN